jgi:hypothetical protein
MSASSHSEPAVAVREVPATFGRKEVRPDPTWEWEFTDALKEKQSREELHAMYSRFSAGESDLDLLMRRVLVRAMCRR